METCRPLGEPCPRLDGYKAESFRHRARASITSGSIHDACIIHNDPSHNSVKEDWYEGYFMPKGTRCLANVWYGVLQNFPSS